MSSYTPVPPPPGPPPPSAAGAPASSATPAARSPLLSPPRRMPVQPPAISTAVHHSNAVATPYLQTPASAVTPHPSTPFSPYASSSNAPSQPSTAPTSASRVSSPMAFRGPSSAVVASYNPQEWGRHHSQSGGQYVPHASSSSSSLLRGNTRDATGMEANMPSPPPPYSPGTPGQNVSAAMGGSPSLAGGPFATPHNTSSPRIGVLNQSPSANTSSPAPAFPPPPPVNGRDRSTSRSRDKRSVFGLSALTGRSRGGGSGSSADQSSTAIDALRQQTTEALARTPGPLHTPGMHIAGPSQQPVVGQSSTQRQWTPEIAIRPPAARRAASTGGIGMSIRDEGSSTPTRTAAWEPGMPLPPPPPGPPPGGSRSQSMTRTSEISSRSSSNPVAAPAPRRPPGQGTTLGPIPPTPAGWQDEDPRNRSKSPWGRALRITTPDPHGRGSAEAGPSEHTSIREPHTAYPSTSASNIGLTRTPARRDPSARGIRERRSESRAAKEKATETQSAVEPSNNPWAADMEAAGQRPANLVLAADEGAISQRRKNTPRSSKGFASPSSGQPSATSSKSYGDLHGESSNSTPKQMTMSPESFAPTPPFSPAAEGFGEQNPRYKPTPGPHHKTLPTPPPHSAGMSSSISSVSSQGERPISHILHTPLDNVPMVVPLQPSRPSSSSSASAGKAPKLLTDQDHFAQAAIERHREFVERETAAMTDQERLELFADFIVNESRLRRDRYSAAFEAMASDILDLTRDMWRSYKTNSTGRRSTTPNKMMDTSPVSQHGRQDSLSSVEGSLINASPSTSSANYSPRVITDSPLSSASSHGPPGRPRGDSTSWQPCLSPIPSMAVSTVPDEEDSRGRSASRWWEGSGSGSHGRGGKKLERSKRESKYMGVQLTEAQEYWENDTRSGGGTPGPSDTAPPSFAGYGPNEYPPEKVGWHDQQIPPPPPSQYYNSSAPTTPDPFRLDVSRLVTLPPPYPRHHPAVNNHHPDLASIRTNLRALQDPADSIAIKEGYRARSDALKEKGIKGTNDRRAELRSEIQERIAKGEMSFSDAAKAEAEFDATEAQITQRRIQQDFDMFQKDVMTPLHALVSERIRKATASVEQLKSGLFDEAQASSPNRPQEEGDEQPELLEKLTLLKWLFEAREQLFRELFELEAERNNLYKTLVLTPYIAAKNQEKVRDAQDFFSKDAHERKVEFEKNALKRFEDFLAVVEVNVTRGVEDQLSAFWDIAPGLLNIVQKVPENLTDDFQIQIPPMEYEENPSYHEHPLQYLFTLLSHAQKSAYQFIESQTNLLCLLHEVKTAVMTANTKFLGTQRVLEGEDWQIVDEEMRAIGRDEEQRLTEDLKDKVNLVEGQWREALGKGIEDCMDRVQVFLLERGGWDECLQE